MDNTFSSTILYTEHFENSGIAACDIVILQMIIKELHERYFFMVKILYIQRYKYQ
jgi:hypothetical protein